MNNEIIKETISFYTICNKLKDTIRKGPIVWNVKRDRIESVAEHIYGTQMLAISIYYQFGYKLDLYKIIYMLAIHELEEIEMGDLAFYEISDEDKANGVKKAVDSVLSHLINKDEIEKLSNEYNERKTEEARFAYHCDKLECDLQMKLYNQEGTIDLNNQANNPIMNLPIVKELLDKEGNISNAWIEFDRSKYVDDPVFINIINWLKENDI